MCNAKFVCNSHRSIVKSLILLYHTIVNDVGEWSLITRGVEGEEGAGGASTMNFLQWVGGCHGFSQQGWDCHGSSQRGWGCHGFSQLG